MKYPERVEEIAKGLDESNFQTAASYLRRQQLDIRYHCERIAELEAQLMQTEMDRDAYKRGAAIAENRLNAADARIVDIGLDRGGLHMQVEGGAAALLASAFGEQLLSSGAENYIELEFTHDSGQRIIVTLQKADGLSPGAKAAKLEAQLKTAKRDAILEAVGNCEDRIARCWSSDLIKYANTIGGDNV